ncbi:hypothetical protein RV10_GL003744 [Enterococcus pallens]|nr:hypothetical protein RV10_GL003744 [Enterococcus pallens]
MLLIEKVDFDEKTVDFDIVLLIEIILQEIALISLKIV